MPRHKQDKGSDYTGPVWGSNLPPIRHGDGTLTLWHDDSPGMRLRVKPCLFRRLGIIRSPFTTLGERKRYYRDQGLKRKRRYF